MDLSFLQGNWVDLVIIIFLITFIYTGIERGFIVNTIDLVGFIASFALALKFYPLISSMIISGFQLPKGIGNAIGFVLLGFALETLFFIIARLIYQRIPENIRSSPVNKFLGPIPALLNGLIIAAFFLTVVVSTPIQPKVKQAILKSQISGPLIQRTQGFEREVAAIFGDALLDTLSFVTIPPTSEEKVDLGFKTKDVTVDPESEQKMLAFVNRERQKLGLLRLVEDAKLREVAREYAKDMFTQGYFSHLNPKGLSPFDRIENAGITFTAAGENLAFAPNTDLAHQGLMQSPGHKANILSSDFGKVGIGVIDGGIYGKMFVQNFTD